MFGTWLRGNELAIICGSGVKLVFAVLLAVSVATVGSVVVEAFISHESDQRRH